MQPKPKLHSPQIWTAFYPGTTVRVRAGVPCPNCATELRASDVVVDRASGSAVLICSGCHRDTLVIERTPGS
jgi:hypothetical protein